MRVADLRKGALALLSIGLAALLLLDAPPASAGLGEDRWLNIGGLSTAIRPNPRGVGRVKLEAINQADRDRVGPLRTVVTRANRTRAYTPPPLGAGCRRISPERSNGSLKA